jgi:hypothetical protein
VHLGPSSDLVIYVMLKLKGGLGCVSYEELGRVNYEKFKNVPGGQLDAILQVCVCACACACAYVCSSVIRGAGHVYCAPITFYCLPSCL